MSGPSVEAEKLRHLPPPPRVHDHGAPVRPERLEFPPQVSWDDVDLRGEDIEIDLRAGPAVVRRNQYPDIDHPWAQNWPTWSSL